jgi:hypothetical protein
MVPRVVAEDINFIVDPSENTMSIAGAIADSSATTFASTIAFVVPLTRP